jgi:hypothetical protein
VNKLSTFVFSFLAAAPFLLGQTEPTLPTSDDNEDLPELKASEILRENILAGPHHRVREEVATSSGANHFIIDSDFGVFEADGNEMFDRRIGEINAIAELKDVSRTDEYKNALKQAAKSPVAAAKKIITDPVNTVKSVPSGIMKFMRSTGESIKSIGKKGTSNEAEGNQLQQMIGFSTAKRKAAIKLGVDPYSSNTVLQKELDGISWATFAGGATLSLVTPPGGRVIGVALTPTGVSNSLQELLRDNSPTDLKVINRKSLVAMGASEKQANQFLDNAAFSPTAQTAFVLNLRSLEDVQNRAAFVRLASRTSSTEADAIFCVQTAALMSKLHNGDKPLAKIAVIGDFPVCIAKDGTTIVALQWDYAAWTPAAERFVESLQAQNTSEGSNLVALSGVVSPRLRQELESRHFQVEDRLAPGPLK